MQVGWPRPLREWGERVGCASSTLGYVGRRRRRRRWRRVGWLSTALQYAPILLKQIPFTQAQFTINELAHAYFSTFISKETVEKAGKAGQIGESLTCGLLAGIGAGIASHPADTLLSKINKGEGGKGGSLSKMMVITREIGFTGLWAGLGTRIIMQAALICAQMAVRVRDAARERKMLLNVLFIFFSYLYRFTIRSRLVWVPLNL